MSEEMEQSKQQINEVLLGPHPDDGNKILAEEPQVESIFNYVAQHHPQLMQAVSQSNELANHAIRIYKQYNPEASIGPIDEEKAQEADQGAYDQGNQVQSDSTSQTSGGGSNADVEGRIERLEQQNAQMLQLIQSFVQDPEGTAAQFKQAQANQKGEQTSGTGQPQPQPQSQPQASEQPDPGGNGGSPQGGGKIPSNIQQLLSPEGIQGLNQLFGQLGQFIALSKAPDQSNDPPPKQSDPTEMLQNEVQNSMGVLKGMVGVFGEMQKQFLTLNKQLGAASQGIDEDSVAPYVEQALENKLPTYMEKALKEIAAKQSDGQGQGDE